MKNIPQNCWASPISRTAKVCECDSIWWPSLFLCPHSVHTVIKAEEGWAQGIMRPLSRASIKASVVHQFQQMLLSSSKVQLSVSEQLCFGCYFHGIEPTEFHFFSHALALYLWHARTHWELERKQPLPLCGRSFRRNCLWPTFLSHLIPKIPLIPKISHPNSEIFLGTRCYYTPWCFV